MEAVNTAITSAGVTAVGVGTVILGALAGLVVISWVKSMLGRR